MFAARLGFAAAAGPLALALGCAQITSTSEVNLVPGSGEPRIIGATGGWELDRFYEARWLQLGNQLVVQLNEHRSCQEIVHVPVVRVEKITRRADATLVWEFVVAGALAGFATFAFSRPEAFGGRYIDNESGEVVVNNTAGYRTGGIFMGIAAILLASGAYDIARSRDETVYTDAFELRPGEPVACAEPVRPVAERRVALVVGEHEHEAVTDREGRARLFLPDEREFADRAGKVTARVVNAAVRLDDNRAVRVDFAVPYDRADAQSHTGHGEPAAAGPRPEGAPAPSGEGALPPGTPPAKAHRRELQRDKEAAGDASPDRSR